MLQDCDFLDRVEALRSWLGFQASGNPFFLPQESCVSTDPTGGFTSHNISGDNVGFDKVGLANVGKQPWVGPLKIDIVQEIDGFGRNKGVRSKKRRLRKTGASSSSLAPYAAAVVNDPTILPAVKPPAQAGSSHPRPLGLNNGTSLDSPPRKAAVDIDCLVPNLVSREDAQRIGVARQALLEEQIRVREAGKSSQARADEVGDDRQRSRASSTVSDAVSCSARSDSRASAASTSGSPTKRRSSHFRQQPARRNDSSVEAQELGVRAASNSERSGDVRAIVLTAAGLLHQPPVEPHPGLGPLLLQSDRPGGEFNPSPFLHTVSDAHSAKTDDLETEIEIQAPTLAVTDRCSTAPLAVPSSTRVSLGENDAREASRRCSVSHRRAVTAPAKMPDTSRNRSPAVSGQRVASLHAPGQQIPTPRKSSLAALTPRQEEREQPGPGYSSRGQGLSRKVGAELRALTAAGTAGRRQPPPREARLRRLARDVARHSAELRLLVREEVILRKRLACCRDDDGSVGEVERRRELQGPEAGAEAVEEIDAVAMMVSVRYGGGAAPGVRFRDKKPISRGCSARRTRSLLENKRREIELKTFALCVRRDELRCLRVVQKQERERQLNLEVERRRAHLDNGQVCGVDTWCINTYSGMFGRISIDVHIEPFVHAQYSLRCFQLNT